jgi:hypothetical protein
MIRSWDWAREGPMLRLAGDQMESLFDGLLPVEVRELPADLAVLDRLLATRGCWHRSSGSGSASPVGMAGRRSRWAASCG